MPKHLDSFDCSNGSVGLMIPIFPRVFLRSPGKRPPGKRPPGLTGKKTTTKATRTPVLCLCIVAYTARLPACLHNHVLCRTLSRWSLASGELRFPSRSFRSRRDLTSPCPPVRFSCPTVFLVQPLTPRPSFVMFFIQVLRQQIEVAD